MSGPSPTSPAIDRRRVAAYLHALERVAYADEGRVALLVETPEPGRHVARDEVTAVPGKGFAGDHARKSFYRGALVPGREVTALNAEVLRVLGVDPVVVGDNLVVEGIDLSVLEPGDRLRVGEVVLRRSDRAHRPCTVFRDRTSPEAFAVVSQGRFRGTLFVVEEGGRIRRGDPVVRIAP